MKPTVQSKLGVSIGITHAAELVSEYAVHERFLLSMRTPHEPEASVECACEEETSSGTAYR